MLGVIAVALQSGEFNPDMSDPSSVLAELGLGWVAFAVVVLATVNTNAINIYSASMGIINISAKTSQRAAVVIASILQLILCFIPLIFDSFIWFFMHFLDFTAGLFVPFWSIVIADYFFVRKGVTDDEIFQRDGGKYWYSNGYNKYGIISLAVGLVTFYSISLLLPGLQAVTSAGIPTIIVTTIVYIILGKKGVKEGYIKI